MLTFNSSHAYFIITFIFTFLHTDCCIDGFLFDFIFAFDYQAMQTFLVSVLFMSLRLLAFLSLEVMGEDSHCLAVDFNFSF